MIYALIVLMTLIILAYVAAWIFVPSLRQVLEAPRQKLLDDSNKFNKQNFDAK